MFGSNLVNTHLGSEKVKISDQTYSEPKVNENSRFSTSGSRFLDEIKSEYAAECMDQMISLKSGHEIFCILIYTWSEK